MSYKKSLKHISAELEKAWQALDVDAMKARLIELEGEMNDPGFWQDQEKAKELSQEAADVKSEVEQWERIRDQVKELGDVGEVAEQEADGEMTQQIEKDVEQLSKDFHALEFQMLFSGEYDKSNAIISIHAGAGGTDAMDWAEMLFRMYVRFAEKKGWKVEILHDSAGDLAGYKHVTFAMRGRWAYGHMRSEAGVHRLVRISPFDAEQMRHTAFALVEAVPEIDEMTEKQLTIDPKDIRVDTFMASGKGGQSVNTTYSAVRLTHLPTNIVVSCQNERSQLQNRETAMRILKSRIFQRMQEEHADKIEELKGEHVSVAWGSQIRSYVLHPYRMVKDHRTHTETPQTDDVLGGDLAEFMESYLRMEAGK